MTTAKRSSPDAQRQARQMARLVEISVTLNSTLDPDQLLQHIIQTAADLLECEAASILLYDEKRNELFFATATGSDPKQLAQIPVPLDSSIAGTIFRQNHPLVINQVEQDPRHYAQVGQQVHFQPRSLLGVPMRIRNRVTGVLEALNKISGDFTEEDVRLLSVIASLAAVAIQNARLIQALQRANEEISHIEKLKSDFIAIASHELRTPLGVILGYATFLKEDTRGELSEHADIVLNSAIKLRVLVEDMTNLNLMQMGSVKLALASLPVQRIIQAAIEEIAKTAQAKGHLLSCQIPKGPIIIRADSEKLEKAFVNLLNNAVRFTPPQGKISVTVKVVGSEVWVEIADNGIGIPAKDLENIFKDFYQVEDHMRRREGGMGLGLSIARSLVRLHNGRIWAESLGEGRGATFIVALPWKIDPARNLKVPPGRENTS